MNILTLRTRMAGPHYIMPVNIHLKTWYKNYSSLEEISTGVYILLKNYSPPSKIIIFFNCIRKILWYKMYQKRVITSRLMFLYSLLTLPPPPSYAFTIVILQIYPTNTNIVNKDGWTPLHVACQFSTPGKGFHSCSDKCSHYMSFSWKASSSWTTSLKL